MFFYGQARRTAFFIFLGVFVLHTLVGLVTWYARETIDPQPQPRTDRMEQEK